MSEQQKAMGFADGAGSYSYKIKQLQAMLDVETGKHPQTGVKIEESGYGANLSHWFGAGIAPINLDADALRCLIRHYKRREKIKLDNALF